MNFSVCIISKNEEEKLPALLASLTPFKEAGGQVYILDTGSTDNTGQIARTWGANVFESTDFNHSLTQEQVEKLNKSFAATGLYKEGDYYFDFGGARNFITSKAETDWVYICDSDEVLEVFDFKQMEIHMDNPEVHEIKSDFYFADGLKFTRCACYRKSAMHYVGVVHEVPCFHSQGPHMFTYLDHTIVKATHKQNTEKPRPYYLTGLFAEFIERPTEPRVCYYLGRDLMYRGAFEHSISVLNRCIEKSVFDCEIAWAHMLIADCYLGLKRNDEAVHHLHLSLQEVLTRAPLIKLSEYYAAQKDWVRSAMYAVMSLEVPDTETFHRTEKYYTYYPWQLLYLARWYAGNKEGARQAFKECIMRYSGNMGDLEGDKGFILG